jgi:hypothetical protein
MTDWVGWINDLAAAYYKVTGKVPSTLGLHDANFNELLREVQSDPASQSRPLWYTKNITLYLFCGKPCEIIRLA